MSVPIAAPVIPYLGINIILNMIFKLNEIAVFCTQTFSLFVDNNALFKNENNK